MISPFGPIGASCLIPPPNLLPIPAAIITNVALLIFFSSFFNHTILYSNKFIFYNNPF